MKIINSSGSVVTAFDKCIVLIAKGIEEIDDQIQIGEDEQRYPYSTHFNKGLNIFSNLWYQLCKDENLIELKKFNTTYFLRTFCSKPVKEWVNGWSADAVKELENSEYLNIGSFCNVKDGYLECHEGLYDVLNSLEESDFLASKEQKEAYTHLISGNQNDYSCGRLLLASKQFLTDEEYKQIQTGRYDFSELLLGDLDYSKVDLDWLTNLLSKCYEPCLINSYVCPVCGWSVSCTDDFIQCSSCGNTNHKIKDSKSVPDNSRRLIRGVMRYINFTARCELEIARYSKRYHKYYELWPQMDTCDVLVKIDSNKSIAIDAKDCANPRNLAEKIKVDFAMDKLDCYKNFYVIPNERIKKTPDYCEICNKALAHRDNYFCISEKQAKHIIRKGDLSDFE